MIKNSEHYTHQATGIRFSIDYHPETGKALTADIRNHRGHDQFVFKSSTPETIKKVASALLEIGEFVAQR